MAGKIISKKRNNDMDMRAPTRAETTIIEEPQIPTYDISGSASLMDEPRRLQGRSRITFLVFCILLLGVFGVAGHFYKEWNSLRQNPQTFSEEKTKEVVARVQKLIDVPSGETPVLATVSDTSNLEDQAFFKNAKEGNIVLFYAVARKAYLYDPAENIIVEVASLGSNEESQ
ncbi:MAG: hypothetical protein NUW02_02955 [Candidatus Campbellbacteria bacterium]|nr:hypothetical protein [Candidatus Campbellbacteria bacterium]